MFNGLVFFRNFKECYNKLYFGILYILCLVDNGFVCVIYNVFLFGYL